MIHYGDITKLNGAELPPVDCITGGSPCQDLSVANGNREGLKGERSGLFMDYVRIVKEMRDATLRADGVARPRYMVWENVTGAFSSNKGRDFQAVLTEIVRIAEPGAPDVPMPTANRGGGASLGACTMDWAGGHLLGEYMTRSYGESPSEENVSHLSQILEDSAPRKYYLSARACNGILTRAKRRGKQLPPALEKALKAVLSTMPEATEGGQ